MDNNTAQRKWRLNLFDIIFIICALAIAGLILLYSSRSGSGSIVSSGTQGTVTYTLELQGMINDTAYLVQPGDELIDKVEKRPMGKVVSVEVIQSIASQKNYFTGDRPISDVPDRLTAVMVVTSDATITDSQISVPGGFIVRVGKWVSVNGPLYNCAGFIVDMERGD